MLPPHWKNALKHRISHFTLNPDTTLRILNEEDPDIRCDRLGPVCWFYCYRPITKQDEVAMAYLADHVGSPYWCANYMQDRGKNPITHSQVTHKTPEEWIGTEEGVVYQFRRRQGLSPGLFLDQRANRRWLRKQSSGLRILNLFSYTGGFSLNAALGGAKEVVSVDINRPFIEWSKKNFELNSLKPEDWEFWTTEARYFLDGCAKRNRTFDLVICDPPSFARSKFGLFRIEDDMHSLLQQIDGVLPIGGRLLFCSNYEKWDILQFRHSIQKTLPLSSYSLCKLPNLDIDVAYGNGLKNLKFLAIRKESDQ